MGVALAAGAALWFTKRRLLGGDRTRRTGPSLTLGDLRSLRDHGHIDDEEYQKLRSATLAQWGVDARTDALGQDPSTQGPETREQPSPTPERRDDAGPGGMSRGEPKRT